MFTMWWTLTRVSCYLNFVTKEKIQNLCALFFIPDFFVGVRLSALHRSLKSAIFLKRSIAIQIK